MEHVCLALREVGQGSGAPRRWIGETRVLIVGNSHETARQLAAALRRDHQWFEVSSEPSLSAGLVRLAREQVDCVLLDYPRLDEMAVDVIGVFAWRAPGVPIVVMSTADSADLAAGVKKAGAEEYVVKKGDFLAPAIDAVCRTVARYAVEMATTRLMEGVFVGRTAELEIMRAGVDEALNGRGRLFLLNGSTGIGKTALAVQVDRYAGSRGMRVVWCRCHETSGSPAYWPWIQIVRACDGEAAVADLWTGLPPGPEVAAHAGGGADSFEEFLPPQAAEYEQARFRWFDAIALVLKKSASRKPTLIVLDDLQWADRSSLLLLRFLGRELSGSPLVILCTYRDGESAMDAGGVRVVSEIRREATTLTLYGLSEDDVRAQVRAISGQRAPAACACVPAIFRRSDGNPLFVEEILRHLLDEAIVYHNGEGWRSRIAAEDIRLPDTVRELAERGLRHLSVECRQLLTVASVVGREFRLDAVAHVSDLPIGHLSGVLDEAVKRRIVEPLPGAVGEYRFCHSPVREILYEELPTVRRSDLHDRVGEYLERVRAAGIDLYAAELAYHFFRAASTDSLRKAANYAQRAAARAQRLVAHHEAARNYELAAQALQVACPDERLQRGLLLLLAGESWWRAAEIERARCAASQAAEILRAAGAVADFARAALTYAGEIPGLGKMVGDQGIVRILEEALAALGEGDSGMRARLLGRLAEEITFLGDRDRRRAFGKQAIEMARRLGDPAVRAAVLKSMRWALWLPENFERREALADEFAHFATASGDDSMRFDAHLLRAFARLERGNMAGAQRDFSASSRLAAELKQPYSSWISATADVCRALALGRLDVVEPLVERAFDLGENAQTPQAALFRGVQLAHLCWLQGRFTELTVLWKKLQHEQPLLLPSLECASILTRCEQGRTEEARAHFERVAADGFGGFPRDLSRVQNLVFLAQACSFLGDAPRAAELYELLQPFDGRVLVFAPALLWGAASHFLGLLAAAMGRGDLARRHFEDALATNGRIGANQWVARTQLAYGELLLASGEGADRERAEALLEQSVQTSESLGMAGVLWQARAVVGRATAANTKHTEGSCGGDSGDRDDPDAHGPGVEGPTSSLRCEGSYWTMVLGREHVTLPDRKGLKLLAILLGDPGREFHVVDLWARIEPLPPDLLDRTPRSIGEAGAMKTERGLGPLLDAKAREEYREKIASLQEELAEAERFNDTARACHLREDLEILEDQIREAIGLGGKSYLVDDPVERIRQKVQKNIRATRRAIAVASRCIGHHLYTHVKTGFFCSYVGDPERPLRWAISFSDERGPKCR